MSESITEERRQELQNLFGAGGLARLVQEDPNRKLSVWLEYLQHAKVNPTPDVKEDCGQAIFDTIVGLVKQK